MLKVVRIVVTINRRQLNLACLSLAGAMAVGLSLPAQAQNRFDKVKVTLAVSGKASFYYLPLTIAEQ